MSAVEYFDATDSYVDDVEIVGGSEESNWLADEAVKLAIPYLPKYRSDHTIILKSITEYFRNNKEVLISDKSKLIDGPDIEYTITLCCNNAFKHANNLTNWIFEKNKMLPFINTIQMRTIVEKEEFKIDYNTKTILHVISLSPYDPDKSQWNYTKAISPVEIDNLRYIPPEIELIDLYNQITVSGETHQLMSTEEKLYNMTLARYKQDGIVETSTDHSADISVDDTPVSHDAPVSGGKSCADRKRDLLDICKIAMIQEWLPKQSTTVILGTWGYNLWKLSKKQLCINQDRVQLCTMLHHKQLIATLQKFINNTINPNLQITLSESRGLNLPGEFRTLRHIYSIVIPDSTGMKEKPFLEIYDLLDYMPVPAVKIEGCLIASKYVMMRFLLIDLWNFTILKTFDKIPGDLYSEKVAKIFRCMRDIRGNWQQPVLILGKFMDYAVYKSNRNKLLSKQGGRFMPYIPWFEKKKSGKLRVI